LTRAILEYSRRLQSFLVYFESLYCYRYSGSTSDIHIISHACTPHTLNALLDDLNALPDLQEEPVLLHVEVQF